MSHPKDSPINKCFATLFNMWKWRKIDIYYFTYNVFGNIWPYWAFQMFETTVCLSFESYLLFLDAHCSEEAKRTPLLIEIQWHCVLRFLKVMPTHIVSIYLGSRAFSLPLKKTLKLVRLLDGIFIVEWNNSWFPVTVLWHKVFSSVFQLWIFFQLH